MPKTQSPHRISLSEKGEKVVSGPSGSTFNKSNRTADKVIDGSLCQELLEKQCDGDMSP